MQKKNKNSQSAILYESKDLKIYADMNAASEAETLYAATQDPIERIRETVQLILRVYSLKKTKPSDNKIYIDKS